MLGDGLGVVNVLAVTAARAAAPASGSSTSTRDGCIAASCAGGAAVRASMPPPAEEEEAAAGGGGVTRRRRRRRRRSVSWSLRCCVAQHSFLNRKYVLKWAYPVRGWPLVEPRVTRSNGRNFGGRGRAQEYNRSAVHRQNHIPACVSCSVSSQLDFFGFDD